MIKANEISRNNLVGQIAEFVSIILDPRVLFSPLVIALALQGSTNYLLSLGWAIFVILIIAFPLILIIIIQTKRAVYADQQVPEKKDRNWLYINGIGCVLLTLLLMISLSGPTNLIKLLFAMLFAGFVGGMINRKIKLSVHTGACAGAVISIVACYGFSLLPLLALVPLIGWSRFALGRHSIVEVFLGGFVGLCLSILIHFVINGLRLVF